MSALHGKYALDAVTGCWLWTRGLHTNGYGKLRYEGRTAYAHRVAYIERNGPIPSGLEIDHLCRQRKCCNPSHLEAVTHAENCQRKPSRSETHCPNGHLWTSATLYIGSSGRRRCRLCRKQSERPDAKARAIPPEAIAKIRQLRLDGLKGREIAELTGVSLRTVWRHIPGHTPCGC